ncbi:MAG: hypothetical protein M3132_14570 [Actinomycetia bacterium]|nr:hypothetical protein [Actinomycetes bacterium]
MTLVQGSGFAVDVPAAWEVNIRPESAMLLSGDDGVIEPAVLHMANFQLPQELAEYGDELYTDLGPADVFVAVIDFGPLAADQGLFGHKGMQLPLALEDFSEDAAVRGLQGGTAAQQFFQASGRGYCLYVVIGSHRERADVLLELNTVLASVEMGTS